MTERKFSIKSPFQVNRRIGEAVFRSPVAKNLYKYIGNPKIRNLLHQKEWIIEYYERDQWKQIFVVLDVCYAERIYIGQNEIPQVVKDISKTTFIELVQLHLCNNHIISLQPISTMKFPFLNVLNLSCNNILSLKLLNKIHFPFLAGLYISGNPIKRLKNLSSFSLINLDILELQCTDSLVTIDEDIKWLSRINSTKVRSVRCESRIRIRQKKAYFMIEKRYRNIKFIIENRIDQQQ